MKLYAGTTLSDARLHALSRLYIKYKNFGPFLSRLWTDVHDI